MAYHARVLITPKEGVLDPQGQAVRQKLNALGYEGIQDVQTGRLIHMRVDATNTAEARARVDEICRRLLVNPVTENFEFELHERPEV